MTTAAEPDPGNLPPAALAALRHDLLTASNDLDRLQSLLADACDTLIDRFRGAAEDIRCLLDEQGPPAARPELLNEVMHELGGALTALQFQDMASQLIQHTHVRLRSCANQLSGRGLDGEARDDAGTVPPPARANPVAQSEMDAGSVELF